MFLGGSLGGSWKNAFHLLLVHNYKFYFLQTRIKMNFRVGLNNRSLVSDASWGRYGVTETSQKTVSWSLDLVNNAIFFKVDEGWPSVKCQTVLRKWIWLFKKTCEGWKVAILYVLYFTAVLSSQTRGETDQEEKLAATLDDTSYRLQTFASNFIALISISCKILTEIHQETFNLDMPNPHILWNQTEKL